ncbi:MAG: leucine--tRNA ligase [Candidatus Nealsonbacteria bacterium]
MDKYDPKKIELKWQKKFEELDLFKVADDTKKTKFYSLVEFPYPSGQGLHVGHCRSYVGMDIISRKKRMQGYNVLFPIGWDAFGLPTENYAIKTGVHPVVVTQKNTDNYRRQLKRLGLSFDWSKEVNTTDPFYYKWTQWIFIQLFKKGLAYKSKIAINWCPSCKIGLANEEVVNDKCERCEKKVVKKEKEQWILKITKYADRLIKDLDKVDYPERVKISQKEWIGKSSGLEIKFQINGDKSINVFTTRPDTLFGCTYMVIAPEHPLIFELKDKIKNYKYIQDYAKKARLKLERERIAEEKNKTGIEVKGIKAINPINKKEIPIFVADYVLVNYGTGAIMAVPSHDERDFDFAKKYNLPIVDVINPISQKRNYNKAYEGNGLMVNSEKFTGMKSEQAKERIIQFLIKKGLAREKIYYKLRDWIFSRQRYWGEPIPMINCQKCGWIPVLENDLPIKLPKIKSYKPTEKGESPLAKVKEWVNVKCHKCNGPAKRETDVMPNWAGSNWYYLAYIMPRVQSSESKKGIEYIWDKKRWNIGCLLIGIMVEWNILHYIYYILVLFINFYGALMLCQNLLALNHIKKELLMG